MIINRNLSALNSFNRLNQNNKASAKIFEKLSSGFKINRAADDAAGLAISEKMRAQIRGMQKVQKNIQDGISLIQTAEGALGSIENPSLIRLRELAIQAANDTLTDEDRKKIQKEVEQIKQHIETVANNTEFNGIKLLNGETTKTIEMETVQVVIPDTFEQTPSVVDFSSVSSITIFESSNPRPAPLTYTISQLVTGQHFEPYTNSKEEYVFTVDLTNNTFTTTALSNNYSGPGNNITAVRLNGVIGYEDTEVWASEIVSHSAGTINRDLNEILGSNLNDFPLFSWNTPHDTYITVNFKSKKFIPGSITTTTQPKIVESPKILKIHTGANQGQNLEVELTDARIKALGIEDIDFTTRLGADKAISVIDGATAIVSSKRSMYGAYQNRLEYTFNRSANYEENLSAAESRIRDTDMAKKSMQLVKSQLLVKSAQSMLIQSNIRAENVVSLLA